MTSAEFPPRWDASFPDPVRLRSEVRAAVGAFRDALFDVFPPGEVRGLYFKGSARKDWDSPLDYVPGLSDVDIHLWAAGDEILARRLGTADAALRIAGRSDALFRERCPAPLHVPRIQLVLLNEALRDEGFAPSPSGTVETLHGEDYPRDRTPDPARIRSLDRRHLLEQESYLRAFPGHAADKPGVYAWDALRGMIWRVSPSAPRLLHLAGTGWEEAWSLNRTALVSRLGALGFGAFVGHYAAFYGCGWAYVLSGRYDGEAGLACLREGWHALSEALRITRELAPPAGEEP